MASPAEDHRDKTVTGYPAPPGHVTSGFPAVQPPSASIYIHQYRPFSPPHRRRGHDGFSFICRFFTAAAAVFSIMGLTFFITWLVLKPQLPEFRVESANFYPLNSTGSELTATWDLTFRVTNPNHKLSVYYDRLEASILFGDEVGLSTTQLPPFSQAKRNETTIRARLGVVGEFVGDEVVRKISENRAHGSVSFGVRMFAWMRFRTGAWRMREHLLKVYCEPLEIGFLRNNRTGTLKGQSKLCQVDIC